jgi:hypothetical protein
MEDAMLRSYGLILLFCFTWALYIMWHYVCYKSGLTHPNSHYFKISGKL